jgi:hypothetical protein
MLSFSTMCLFVQALVLMAASSGQAARSLTGNAAQIPRDQRSLLNTFPFNAGAEGESHDHAHAHDHAHDHALAPAVALPARLVTEELSMVFKIFKQDIFFS